MRAPPLAAMAIATVLGCLSATRAATPLPSAHLPLVDRCEDLAGLRDSGALPLRRESAAAPDMSDETEMLPQSSLRTRKRFQKPAETVFDPQVHTGRIVLKLADDEGFRIDTGGALTAPKQARAIAINEIVTRIMGATDAKRVFARPETSLAFDRFCGERWMGEEMPDLTQFVLLSPRERLDVAAMEAVIWHLNSLPFVELAYFEGRAPTPAAPLPDASKIGTFEALQGYLKAAPEGVDAYYAWTKPGGTGANVKVVDVELGWNIRFEGNQGHEDRPLPFVVIGRPTLEPAIAYHGSAVVGIIAGVNNSLGVTGIVHDAAIGVSATDDQNVASIASAINQASAVAGTGNVIVVETHILGPVTLEPGRDCAQSSGPPRRAVVPAEYDVAAYSAITVASANQRIVVEAAGNGAVSLAHSLFGGIFDSTSPGFQESHAIIVGGRSSATGVPKCETNFGERIDASAWGENVATAGGSALWRNLTPRDLQGEPPDDSNNLYTSEFSGTSSATAIVAAVVASVQSMQLGRLGPRFPPTAMRKLVRMFGTPQGSDPRQIGVMPDLKAIYEWIVADDDLDGMTNGDEVAVGRNPGVSEVAVLSATFAVLEE